MLIPALREIADGPQLDDDSHLRESDRHTPMARASRRRSNSRRTSSRPTTSPGGQSTLTSSTN